MKKPITKLFFFFLRSEPDHIKVLQCKKALVLALIDEVKDLCDRLVVGDNGWRELLNEYGIDITSDDLKTELEKSAKLDGKKPPPGFEDFSDKDAQGIKPGDPAKSLLYHALASPNVTKRLDRKKDLSEYPTLADIEMVENYVYAAKHSTLEKLKAENIGKDLAIVVFVSEYRPAQKTAHKKHADLCFARTGVARVGTKKAEYEPKNRGFSPFVKDDDNNSIRVLPAKYSAYLAIKRENKEKEIFSIVRGDDPGRGEFWVPIHKLFNGKECLGKEILFELEAHHVNEKFRRIYLELARLHEDDEEDRWDEPQYKQPQIDNPPFKFTKGIAELSPINTSGTEILVPDDHPSLIEEAKFENDKPLTFRVPANPNNNWSPSYTIDSQGSEEGQVRHAPEYVHVRKVIRSNRGLPPNLNDIDDVAEEVKIGDYEAQHYKDFTGDGWITVSLQTNEPDLPEKVMAAYSLVTAPDFYPNCDQGELNDWSKKEAPEKYRPFLWPARPPHDLSERRTAANIELGKQVFDKLDKTMTAIISLAPRGEIKKSVLDAVPKISRHSFLPDAAASVFQPGWDVSLDFTDNILHLSAYGLGSPFPEDAKLCAFLSTFWPAASPDTARTFDRNEITANPMTDEELGFNNNPSWDGFAGPKKIKGQNMVEYASFDHADYVDSALKNKFSLSLTSKVDFTKYKTRTLAMLRAYDALGFNIRASWRLLSFRETSSDDDELKEELNEAQEGLDTKLKEPVYRFVFFRPGNRHPHPQGHRKLLVEIMQLRTFFVGDEDRVRWKEGNGDWKTEIVRA